MTTPTPPNQQDHARATPHKSVIEDEPKQLQSAPAWFLLAIGLAGGMLVLVGPALLNAIIQFFTR